jgi:prepilin-type processing-associated H-X9-DG protein
MNPGPFPRVRGNYALNWGAVGFPVNSSLTFTPLPTARAPFGFVDAKMQLQDQPRRSRIKDFIDGTSKTMMMSEKIMHPSDMVQDQRGDILNDDGTALYMTINTPNTSAVDYMKLAQYCDVQPSLPCSTATAATGIYHSARSKHVGGLNTGFADGSVRFVRDSIPLKIWQAYGTMDGGESINDPGE